jgi:hypothetical protein
MGVLQDFERRLEGAVEGFFARAFRSGLQPVELAKALQRYAEDNQHVTDGGVVVPNVFRFTLSPKDVERLESFGTSLRRELAQVAARTADERGWKLRGPVHVLVEPGDSVKFGMYELTGRVEASQVAASAAASGRPAGPAPAPAASEAPPARGEHRITLPDGTHVRLERGRMTLGRLATCDVTVDDRTVSREHAALVRRGGEWWIVDLGSTNGTTVNGTRAAEQPLNPGDRIRLGEVELEFGEA